MAHRCRGLILLNFDVYNRMIWLPKCIFRHWNNRPRPVIFILKELFFFRHLEAGIFSFLSFNLYFERLAIVIRCASQNRVLFLLHALPIPCRHLNLRGNVLVFLALGLQQIHGILLKLFCCVMKPILYLGYIFINREILSSSLVCQGVILLNMRFLFFVQLDLFDFGKRKVNIRFDPRHLMKGVPVVTFLV